jgi:hypothetical protein
MKQAAEAVVLATRLTLNMEATYSSETLVNFQWTTQQNHHCENLTSYKCIVYFLV